MVQRLVSLDDLDGTPATTTIAYSYAGTNYEIDLNDEHASEFDQQLSQWIEHSRRVGTVQPRQRRSRRGEGERRSPEELRAIRQWARQEGLKVSDRGRIAADIIEKYKAAH